MSSICAKEFSVSNFKQAVFCQISIFQESDLNFTYSQKNFNFLSIIEIFLEKKNYIYLYDSSMREIVFFNFASGEPLDTYKHFG